MRLVRNYATGLIGTAALLLLTTGTAEARRIEAVKGKTYTIDKRHGPWMIMVASFRKPTYGNSDDGMTPQEAAQQLVYELRRKGIPAYTVSQREVTRRITTLGRFREEREATYIAQHDGICVLAGNYPSMRDSLAQRTLAYVKRMHPQFMQQQQATNGYLVKLKNGGIYRKSSDGLGPLAGAFLTVNPLLSSEEVMKKRRDTLLVRLNAGNEHSLLDNPGKYSLIVASFYGQPSVTVVGDRNLEDVAESYKVTGSLDEAGERAWELANALRNLNSSNPALPNYEAYIYHDRHRSIVTVGAFDSPDDPGIAKLKKNFGAKIKQHPDTGKPFLAAEVLAIPPSGGPPIKSWLFDPYPELIKVPDIQR